MAALPLPAPAQRRGAESLPGLLAVIIAGFCFHFCCLMLLILLTIALKVVHRTLRCANNKNAERKRRCKVYRTHGHAPCRRASPLSLLLSASSRPRVLQKITKILFAAMQLLPKKNHRAKAEVGVAHSGCWLLAAGCGCFSICFTLFTRRTAQRKLPGRSVYSFRFR